VLVVQDIFSREIWARALRTAKTTEVVTEFKDILKVSERSPTEMNADRGVEFQSKEFKAMLETQGIKIFREAVSKNDLATLDRAIATLKQIITRRVVSQGGGNWVEELQTGVRSYNKTAHTHLGMQTPESVEGNDSLRFDLQQQASKDGDTQSAVTKKREQRLTDATTYRAPVVSKLKGFAVERSFKPKFEEEVRELERIEGRYVVDKKGRKTLAARAKPVPADSNLVEFDKNTTSGDARIETKRKEATFAMAKDVAATIGTEGKDITSVTKSLTAEQRTILKENKIDTKKMIELHSDIFGREGRIIKIKRKNLAAIPFNTIKERLKRLRERQKN
jgi:hypothetical protein